MVSKTSINAYNDLIASGVKYKQREAVLACVQQFQPITRRKVSQITGLELGAVAGRTNKLIEDGLLVEDGVAKCATTKKIVKTLRAK